MKNLIVAITFAMFSLTLPLSMAQQVVETDSAVEVDAQEVETKIEKDGKRIVIDINTNEAGDAEDEIRDVIESVHEIFGEELGRELANELEGLDEDDRKELKHKLKKVFGENTIHIGDGEGGIGFSEFLIAMTAIVFTLGLPVIILVLVLVFSNRKRKQKMQLISSYLEADQPVPAHVMAEFGSDTGTNSTFRSGLTLTLVGLAIAIFLGVVEDWETATLGLIPIAIGVARLVSWKYGNDQNNGPSQNDSNANV